MRRIIKYHLFEDVKTTLDFGYFGPGYPRQKTPGTIQMSDTSVIFLDLEERMYSFHEYQQLYYDYLKTGGMPLEGFNKQNLLKVLGYDVE